MQKRKPEAALPVAVRRARKNLKASAKAAAVPAKAKKRALEKIENTAKKKTGLPLAILATTGSPVAAAAGVIIAKKKQ